MAEEIVYCGIGVSENGISEIQDGQKIVSIKKEDIRRIQFQKTIAEERPLILVLLGIVLMIPGILVSKVFFQWLRYGGTLQIEIGVTLLFILLMPVGLLLIFFALRKKYLLLIDLDKGRRKIPFKGKLYKDEFNTFIENAKKAGYDIQILEDIS